MGDCCERKPSSPRCDAFDSPPTAVTAEEVLAARWGALVASTRPQSGFSWLATVADIAGRGARGSRGMSTALRSAQVALSSDPIASASMSTTGCFQGDGCAPFDDEDDPVPKKDDEEEKGGGKGAGGDDEDPLNPEAAKEREKPDPETTERRATKCCKVHQVVPSYAVVPGGNPTTRPRRVGSTRIPKGMFIAILKTEVSMSWHAHAKELPCTMTWEERSDVSYPGNAGDGKWHQAPPGTDQVVQWGAMLKTSRKTGSAKPSVPPMPSGKPDFIRDTPGYKPSGAKPSRSLEGKVTFRSGCPDGPTIVLEFTHAVTSKKGAGGAQSGTTTVYQPGAKGADGKALPKPKPVKRF